MKSLSSLFSERSIDAAGTMALLLLAGVVYAGAAGPIIEARASESRVLTEASQVSAELSAAEAAVDQAVTRVRRLETILADNSLGRSDAAHINERLHGIAQLATDAGVLIDRVQPGAAVAIEGTRRRTSVALTARAGYAQATRLLRDLHATFADTVVEGFSVEAGGDAESNVGAFRLDLVWYSGRAGRAGAPQETTVPAP